MKKTLYIVLGLLAIASASAALGEIEEARELEEKYPSPESSPLEALEDPSSVSRYLRSRGDRRLARKKTAAQKRQDQRDARRHRENPNRTQQEERAERLRKHQQAIRRGKPSVDPYNRNYGDPNYAKKRERGRGNRCRRTGEGCNYHALEWDAWDRKYNYDPIHDEYYD
ncbi:hypothetical protein ACHAXT_004102 [Thalassiosira profunda]